MMNKHYRLVSETINIHNALAVSKKFNIGSEWKPRLLSSGFITAFVGIVNIFKGRHSSIPDEIRQTIETNLFDKTFALANKLAKKVEGGVSSETTEILETLIFFRLTSFTLYQLEMKFSKKIVGIYRSQGWLETPSQETVFKNLLRHLRFELESRYDEYISDITGDYTTRELSISLNHEIEEPPVTDEREELRGKSKDLDRGAIISLIRKMQMMVKRDIGIPLARKFIENLKKEIEARKAEMEA